MRLRGVFASSRGVFALLLTVALLGAPGCRVQQAPSRVKVIAFSSANNAEPYRAAQLQRLQQLVAAHPEIRLVAADAQQDNARQIAQVETFIRQRPSVLIVAPNERTALTQVMSDAMDAHIPVICLERDIVLPNYTSYIRVDNLEIGRMAGRFLVSSLTKKFGKPRGNVVFLRGLLGVEAEIHRDQGAREMLSPYPDIHIVAEPVANWNQSEGKDRMTEVLRAHPQIDAVYGHSDAMAVGGYLAAREVGREKEIIFVGTDGLGGPAGGIQEVMEGVLQATFVYPLCVDKAFEITLGLLSTPPVIPAKIYTMPSTMVTPENAAQLYKASSSTQEPAR